MSSEARSWDRGLNVLHVTTGIEDGGAEAVLYRLVTSDSPDHHAVVSLTGPGKYGEMIAEAGMRVHALGLPRGRLRPGPLARLWRIMRAERPDVVQTWMYHGDLVGGSAARLAGVPAVVWGIHNSTLQRGRSKPGTMAVARLNAGLSRVVPRRIICCSNRSAELHWALGYARARFRVVANGYDFTHFHPDPAARARLRAELGVADDEPLLGMVARFDPQKDHANLLAALGILKRRGARFRCLLVGPRTTADSPDLVRTVAEHGLEDRVTLLGPRGDIPAVMNALDLHVLSSAYGEAFPNVVCEAMACGTPCVVTDVGDCAAIVAETGWTVPPSDAEALARAIGEALAVLPDPDRAAAAEARIRDNYSLARMVEAYRGVWHEALAP